MSAADTAKLLASLELQDKFSGPSKNALGSLGKLETGFDRLSIKGVAVGTAIGNGLSSLASQGLRVLQGALGGGLDSLATLESAVSSVDGAIAQVGLTGKLTGKQVADWANQIESDVGAAFDDKAITQAATTLLRFGNVTADNLRPALVVMTDLATKTGDIDSAASLLAKALADPEKAAGKLARAGVVLTKEQQDQIQAMVESGDTAKAQAFLLDQLATATKGAAAASQGPFRRAQAVLRDTTEDAQRALAIGFLPIIEKVSAKLSKGLADPAVLANIQSFGEKLAGGLDEALTIVEKIPWGAIASGLQAGAEWAGKLFDVFRNLPPEVQTTIVALAGINKLSGGTVSSLVGELGKGLIKGVLGMNAGVVNINAATVNGGAGGGGAAGGGSAGLLAGLAGVGSFAGLIALQLGLQSDVKDNLQQQLDAFIAEKNARAADATETESLLRANLTRSLPIPTVTVQTNISVPVNVSAGPEPRVAYAPQSTTTTLTQTYTGGAPLPTFAH